MKFYEIHNDWSWIKGVWAEGEEDLYEMDLTYDDTSDNEDDFVFDYWNWQEPDASWFCQVTIIDGTWDVYVDNECIGSLKPDKDGNVTESILLGMYDLIEGWFNA